MSTVINTKQQRTNRMHTSVMTAEYFLLALMASTVVVVVVGSSSSSAASTSTVEGTVVFVPCRDTNYTTNSNHTFDGIVSNTTYYIVDCNVSVILTPSIAPLYLQNITIVVERGSVLPVVWLHAQQAIVNVTITMRDVMVTSLQSVTDAAVGLGSLIQLASTHSIRGFSLSMNNVTASKLICNKALFKKTGQRIRFRKKKKFVANPNLFCRLPQCPQLAAYPPDSG